MIDGIHVPSGHWSSAASRAPVSDRYKKRAFATGVQGEGHVMDNRSVRGSRLEVSVQRVRRSLDAPPYAYGEPSVPYFANEQRTVVVMPPRAENSPLTVIRRGESAATSTSRISFVAAS